MKTATIQNDFWSFSMIEIQSELLRFHSLSSKILEFSPFLLGSDILILEKKRYFIRNGHKILKNPPKSIIHDYGVIGYFLKSWNWILEYYKTHWIQNHSDSFKLRLIQVLELENFQNLERKECGIQYDNDLNSQEAKISYVHLKIVF